MRELTSAGQRTDPSKPTADVFAGFPIGGEQRNVRIRQLSNIQILRGIAAVMVLVYHIGNELEDRGFEGYVPNLGSGSAGVDIFFVISGFIMIYSTVPAFGTTASSFYFLMRRIVRLVPLYWAITTVFVLVAVREAHHTALSGQTIRWFVASYAFLFYPRGEGGDFPLYAQGWTLNFEMFFYVCFAAALPWRRAVAVTALSVAFVGFAALGQAVTLPWPADRWSNTNIIEFVLGMLLAEAYLRGLRVSLPVAIGLAVAGFAFMIVSEPSVDSWLPYRGVVWGPPATAIVMAAACHHPESESSTVRDWIRKALEALGDASYSLYLVHFAFFVALASLLGRTMDVLAIPIYLYACILFFGAIAAAFATYVLLERPVTRFLNRNLGLSRRWRAIVKDGDPRS